MRHAIAAIGVIAVFLSGCSSSDERSNESQEVSNRTTEEVVPGYKGGCEPFAVYTQNDSKPYGALFREDVRVPGAAGGEDGNVLLYAVGWYKAPKEYWVKDRAYRKNPEGFQTKVWYYVEDVGWFADASVRDEETQPSPDIDPSTAAPMSPECELTR